MMAPRQSIVIGQFGLQYSTAACAMVTADATGIMEGF